MSFCFNFDIPSEDLSTSEEPKAKIAKETDSTGGEVAENVTPKCQHGQQTALSIFRSAGDGEVEPAREIFIEERIEDLDDFKNTLTLTSGETIHYIQLTKKLKDRALAGSRISEALEANLDVVREIYEGGLKIWECSMDLADYLSSLPKNMFEEQRVLEVGCGVAIPGLYSFTHGAMVTYQDYNWEVLKLVTIPNVLLNSTGLPSGDRARFIAGDWSCIQKLLAEGDQKDSSEKYDMILTSETIYSPDLYEKLHDFMAALLKPTGVVYLAAKTCYFGVGGGIRDFEKLIENRGVFTSKVVKEFTEGVQREILELKFSQTNN